MARVVGVGDEAWTLDRHTEEGLKEAVHKLVFAFLFHLPEPAASALARALA